MASTYIVVIFQMSLPAVKGSVAARPTRQIKIPHFSSLFDICGDTWLLGYHSSGLSRSYVSYMNVLSPCCILQNIQTPLCSPTPSIYSMYTWYWYLVPSYQGYGGNQGGNKHYCGHICSSLMFIVLYCLLLRPWDTL